jgi:hypothetical protein
MSSILLTGEGSAGWSEKENRGTSRPKKYFATAIIVITVAIVFFFFDRELLLNGFIRYTTSLASRSETRPAIFVVSDSTSLTHTENRRVSFIPHNLYGYVN